MKDIELRFVERPLVQMVDEIIGRTSKVRILQFRKRLLDGWEQEYWTDWQDVPLEQEEV
jgi:hypothetical protein